MDINNLKWASAVIGNEAYKTDITLDSHTLVADEPVTDGGKDLGPAPGDFLRISLASCTAITLRMYATRKKYDVQQIEVKVHSEEINGKTIFHRNITLNGKMDLAQRKRMLEIAEACPIHKVLTNPIEVLTHLV